MRRVRRRTAIVIGSLVGTAVLVVLAGLPVYVFPAVDAPQHTDVVMVLGNSTPSRVALAERLVAEGYSDTLVISRFNQQRLPVCDEPQVFTVYCFTPDPFTTQGEARYLGELAAAKGWSSATVITFTPHITRARLIVSRCFTGKLDMVADTTPLSIGYWAYQYLYQTGGFIKAALNPGC